MPELRKKKNCKQLSSVTVVNPACPRTSEEKFTQSKQKQVSWRQKSKQQTNKVCSFTIMPFMNQKII